MITGSIVFFLATGYYLIATKDVALDPEKLLLNDNKITVYDRDGVSVENVSAFVRKQTVLIEDIPAHTKLAFISIEDKRFYSHNGFDVKRIAKAAWNNLIARSFKEGASTISQQLVKNTHLSQEKTIQRKLQEWKLTHTLEKRYTKDDILEKYLNSIYFGHSAFGIHAAAEFYFGKTPQELDLADSAILAGLVKSPNRYSPFKSPESCEKRKNCVLASMVANGVITEAEKENATKKPLPIMGEQLHNHGYLSFVFDELSAISEAYDLRLNGNIEIFTGLDAVLQAEIECIAQTKTDCDQSMMILDAQTGNFKACYSTVGNIRRLPGSLIKPLLVYAPALEEDVLVPATPILDEKVNYGGYSPENYNGNYNGYVSVRECVAKSLNIPAVKILQSLGIAKGVYYLQKMGLPVDKDDHSLALALGGMKYGYTLRDIMNGYFTLQTGGIQKNAGFISEIVLDGKTIYVRPQTFNRIFSEDSSYLMADMLKTTAKTGTAKKLHALPFDVAAKTGTVGTENGNTDAYALSYTTRDVVGIWLGNKDNSPISHTGGGDPCNTLLQVNTILYEQYQNVNQTIPPFQMPTTVRRTLIDKITYDNAHCIQLADDLAPAEYYFEELFKVSALPSKKSAFFSIPTILPPTIDLSENGIRITLDISSPILYNYTIDRYDYASHTTVYHGAYLPNFIDSDVERNKRYVYTVTPSYQDQMGIPVTLPTINTAVSSKDEILDKNWWEY